MTNQASRTRRPIFAILRDIKGRKRTLAIHEGFLEAMDDTASREWLESNFRINPPLESKIPLIRRTAQSLVREIEQLYDELKTRLDVPPMSSFRSRRHAPDRLPHGPTPSIN